MAISSRSVEKPLVTKLVYDDYRPKKSKMTQKLLFFVLMICRDADLRSFESYMSLIRVLYANPQIILGIFMRIEVILLPLVCVNEDASSWVALVVICAHVVYLILCIRIQLKIII